MLAQPRRPTQGTAAPTIAVPNSKGEFCWSPCRAPDYPWLSGLAHTFIQLPTLAVDPLAVDNPAARSGHDDQATPPHQMIALGIIEAEPTRREALWQYLSAQPEFVCVLCVGSHQDFLAGLKQLETKPRLVLADIHLPGCSGLAGLADLRHRLPEVALFILGGHRQAECVVEALREGAAGYLEYSAPYPYSSSRCCWWRRAAWLSGRRRPGC